MRKYKVVRNPLYEKELKFLGMDHSYNCEQDRDKYRIYLPDGIIITIGKSKFKKYFSPLKDIKL